jgi:hypothetical protein
MLLKLASSSHEWRWADGSHLDQVLAPTHVQLAQLAHPSGTLLMPLEFASSSLHECGAGSRATPRPGSAHPAIRLTAILAHPPVLLMMFRASSSSNEAAAAEQATPDLKVHTSMASASAACLHPLRHAADAAAGHAQFL